MGFGAVEFLAMGTGILLMLLLCTFFVLLASAMMWFGFCDRIHVACASLWMYRCRTLQHMLILNSPYPCQRPSLLANMTLNQQLSVLCLFLVLVYL